MNIFSSPRQKRSKRLTRTPFNSWNINSRPPLYSWTLSPFPPPSALPWISPLSTPALPPSPAQSWGTSGRFSPNDWLNSWYPSTAFSTPQTPWTAPLPSVQPWLSPTTDYNIKPIYDAVPDWDISTPPATAPAFSSQPRVHWTPTAAFPDLAAEVPEHVETIRIYVEKPAITYWTKQWGYATAHKRSGRALTLRDVLEAVYHYFQEPLAADALPPQYQSALAAVYSERIALNGPPEYAGLARVDVLNGLRVLAGMRQLNYAADASGIMYIALSLRAI
ncbi:hypothetical protein B0H15DRAFT_819959 [Mycena belliarum]|uniref:DUF6699 domain-containing protein n=1 Tax=Mycena belliarum TaxID=1033014 RepID=A0AAD6UJX1_9AGAR|nr:hypothetical protein B0H15DRAFT_819959 [Mycena belliae]